MPILGSMAKSAKAFREDCSGPPLESTAAGTSPVRSNSAVAPNEFTHQNGAWLVDAVGGYPPRSFALDPERPTILGRSHECHVQVHDPLCSREHARLLWSESRWTIEDLGSRNGLWVNDQFCSAVRALADGDRISLGPQT